ncbi:MAG: hypothetical protein QMD61_00930 [Methanobacterium sp.]|nr:hypothetical protein [Methanobacterium sp.]
MGGGNINKKVFAAVALLFMVLFSFQLAEPVSALKLVDKGTKFISSEQFGDMKISWKTYKFNRNYLKIYSTTYIKNPDTGRYVVSWHHVITLSKVSRKRIKIKDWTDSELAPGTIISYDRTRLSAYRYYWSFYRSQIH